MYFGVLARRALVQHFVSRNAALSGQHSAYNLPLCPIISQQKLNFMKKWKTETKLFHIKIIDYET